jgi:hypothetical protein
MDNKCGYINIFMESWWPCHLFMQAIFLKPTLTYGMFASYVGIGQKLQGGWKV